jgi:hypothetical protein
MTPYHDRMSVLLRQEAIDRWLSGEMEANELHPASESALREWPMDRRINRSGEGGASLCALRRRNFLARGSPCVAFDGDAQVFFENKLGTRLKINCQEFPDRSSIAWKTRSSRAS